MSNTLENLRPPQFLHIYGAFFTLAVAIKHAEDAFRRPQLLRTRRSFAARLPLTQTTSPGERAAHSCCEATPTPQRTRTS